jgi:hypothetical protein
MTTNNRAAPDFSSMLCARVVVAEIRGERAYLGLLGHTTCATAECAFGTTAVW